MKRFEFEDCIKEGLLRKVPPSKEKAERSISTANKWLEEAKKNFKNETFNSSVLASYLAMFHSARAVLFFDGFREKSHCCIARYIEEKYVNKKLLENEWVEKLDHYRELRHNSQYDISFFTSNIEAETALKTAVQFTNRIRKLLESIKNV